MHRRPGFERPEPVLGGPGGVAGFHTPWLRLGAARRRGIMIWTLRSAFRPCWEFAIGRILAPFSLREDFR